VNNRTVIYSQWAGWNGSTFMDSMIGTMAGMAIYDMITDDKGNQVKVEQYYVSGEQRIPVGTGSVTPKTVTQTVPDEPTDWSVFFKWFFGISATVIILGSMFSSSNRY